MILDTLALYKKHTFICGKSRAGKTRTALSEIQELLLQGINVICVDTQTDIISMALYKEHEIKNKEKYNKYKNDIDIKIYTPVSNLGIPICINPFLISDLDNIAEIDMVSALLVDILGFSNDKNKDCIKSLFHLTLETKIEQDKENPKNKLFDDFLEFGELLLDVGIVAELLNARTLDNIFRKCKSCCIGINNKIFEFGEALQIEKMMEKNDKTKLSIIHINTIEEQKTREFFLSYLCGKIYSYILKRPSQNLKYVLFIDECEPFLPFVRKPCTKEILSKLSRQSAKFGLGLILATQNPGDIDYRCLDQFENWYIGRIKTKQSLMKIKHLFEASCSIPEFYLKKVQLLEQGEFFIISPDQFDKPEIRKSGEIFFDHRPLNIEEIKKISENVNSNYDYPESEPIDEYLDEEIIDSSNNNLPVLYKKNITNDNKKTNKKLEIKLDETELLIVEYILLNTRLYNIDEFKKNKEMKNRRDLLAKQISEKENMSKYFIKPFVTTVANVSCKILEELLNYYKEKNE